MADDWLNERDGFDTLRIPSVFVPEGATAPADWVADHPLHIRVPATFVSSRRSPSEQAEMDQAKWAEIICNLRR